jgi:hypothetical protein
MPVILVIQEIWGQPEQKVSKTLSFLANKLGVVANACHPSDWWKWWKRRFVVGQANQGRKQDENQTASGCVAQIGPEPLGSNNALL